MSIRAYGLNEHLVALALKELVRRAIVIAQRQITTFESGGKIGYDGEMSDVFTSADKKAQASYVKSLQEGFPNIGIIGEEDSLNIPSADGLDAYFTIDPLDGTRAYIRRQSHGVGTMVALVIDGVIESAYIGDLNTQEVFGYRPESSHVWRITDLEVCEELNSNPPERAISELYILLREREKKYSEIALKTIDAFKGVSIDGGSIGIWAARLWKGEVGALLLYPGWETPWDSSPVVGISQKLGYVFLRPFNDAWEVYQPQIGQKKYWRDHEAIIIHSNNLLALSKVMRIYFC
ncbi:MAG: inositol monophosphatase family protein [Candidatus Moraniibacteriota bacterium]